MVLVLDGSGSMAATDYPPTRLESAKVAVSMVLGGSEHGSVYKYLEGFRRRKR